MNTIGTRKFIASITAMVTFLLIALRKSPDFNVVHAASPPITWRQQIAPLVYKNCTSCHHGGGSGPFALMTYGDARRWGSQMKTVTSSRYMPPWLPEPGHGSFEGDRRLTDAEIAMIKTWVESGMPEGEGSAPKSPVYGSDWVLGTPDLILEMAAPMQIPAGGTDLFENFILPTSLKETKWVRAMEIKPGSPQVVHHANVILDRTASLRRAHPNDWQRGILGVQRGADPRERRVTIQFALFLPGFQPVDQVVKRAQHRCRRRIAARGPVLGTLQPMVDARMAERREVLPRMLYPPPIGPGGIAVALLDPFGHVAMRQVVDAHAVLRRHIVAEV